MPVNYLNIIIDTHCFDELVVNSTSDNKQLYVKLFQSALTYIKTKDYIWGDDFVDPTFIQWGIDWVNDHDDEYIESKLNEYVTHITRLMNDFDGYWFKQEIIDILEDEHYFAENFAISAMVYAINGLTDNNDKFLYLATRCESFMYFAEVAAKSLLRAEEQIDSRNKGLKKSRNKRSSKSPIALKIDHLASTIWQELPELSSSAAAESIYSNLSWVLSSYQEYQCEAFYELGLFDEVSSDGDVNTHAIPHPDHDDVICIPTKLKSVDAIRKQITPLKPATDRKNNSRDYIQQVQKILAPELTCSNNNCQCKNNF